MTGDPIDRARNREVWAAVNADVTDPGAAALWGEAEVSWGLFRIPEATLGVVGDVRGLTIAELGCGTAYLSAWLARAGANPVAVDLSRHQLATAARTSITSV